MLDVIRAYRASLKSIDVEEPIDLFVHRPLAFVVAKLAERTPLTPNHLTLISMSLGLVAGVVLLRSPVGPAPLAGALLFSSQVIDCSDGMLARMRKSSSEIGRMLDGVADVITLTAAVAGATWMLVRSHPSPSWLPFAMVIGAALTSYTSSLHTSAYDHYKNLHLALTVGSREEDLDQALARHRAASARPMPLAHRIIYWIYLGFLKQQVQLLAWFDPSTTARYSSLPAHDPRVAAAYRRHNGRLLDVWRSLFGLGSVVFGFALFTALGHLEIYLFYRLVVLNAVFFGWLMPAQRRASRAIAHEIGLAHGPASSELRPSAV